MVNKTLIAAKQYLQSGTHIGAKFKTDGMRTFIFKKRPDKLKVLDIGTIDERLRMASQLLATFEAGKIAVVSQKEYGQIPAKKFADAIGAKAFIGRFVPGTFTNPESKNFFEADLVIVTDPNIDAQAIKEASMQHIPVIALCSTDNRTDNIDLIVPCNNKGRKSLALIYWVIAREVMKARESINKDEEFSEKIEEFEFKPTGVEQ